MGITNIRLSKVKSGRSFSGINDNSFFKPIKLFNKGRRAHVVFFPNDNILERTLLVKRKSRVKRVWRVKVKKIQMKAAISSLVTSKNLSLHCPSSPLSRSAFLHSKPLPLSSSLFSLKPTKTHHQSRTNLTKRSHFHTTTSFSSIMASSYKPEQARAPPALPLPAPSVTKASSIFLLKHFLFLIWCLLLVLSLFVSLYWNYGVEIEVGLVGFRVDFFSLRSGCVNCR